MKQFCAALLLILLLFPRPLRAAGEAPAAAPAGARNGVEERPWLLNLTQFAFYPLPELTKGEPTGKRLSGKVTTGFQYDTNVPLVAEGVAIQGAEKTKDGRWVAGLRANLALLKDERADAALTYSFFQSCHFELDDFNMTQNFVELSGGYRLTPRLSLRGYYAFHHLLVGGDTFDTFHIVGPSLIIQEGSGFSTAIDYRYRDTVYRNVSIYTTNADRSSGNNLVGISQNIPLGAAALLRVGYTHDEDDTRREYLTYSGNKWFSELSLILPHDSLFDVYGEIQDKDYAADFPYPISTRRADTTYTVAVTAATYFAEQYGLSLRVLYYRNKSNISYFDYERIVPSILFDAKF
ncbi:hypothetical protein GURASL_10930 [Geotalea uraniireducens]|uniref:DUF3187 family protein n=1 Tax=Geotalea uraniireducens TaxID=351604 RepID=A0ABN6VST2_9BACT|nr:hypothetical protein [Geotalea uraniireducens]BDV42170.1 hypothetical protein GURASL_10930 [Geotalea uraniireducens]